MHPLARTVGGLRVELVVRDHSEKLLHSGVIICGQYDFCSHSVARGAVGDGPVAGTDDFTNNSEGSFLSLSQTLLGR